MAINIEALTHRRLLFIFVFESSWCRREVDAYVLTISGGTDQLYKPSTKSYRS